MSRQQQSWILIGVFLAMAVLQISLAGRQCLWVDEVFSLAIATGHSLEHSAATADPAKGDFVESDHPVPAADLQRYLVHENPPASPWRVLRAVLLSDTSPPLYYLLLYGWTMVIGTSDLALRCFSILAYLAAFPFLIGVARRTAGEGAVIPACILFAFSPVGLYFSGEGRMYSLLVFCVVATAWVSLILHDRGKGLGFYILWVLLSAAGLLTHYFFALPLGAMVISLLIRPGQFGRGRLVLCLSCLALVVLPWYVTASAYSGHWRITQGWLKMEPTHYNSVRAVRNHFLQFFSPGGSGLWKYQRWSALSSLALFALVAGVMMWRQGWRTFAGQRLMIWLWFGFAAGMPSVLDLLQGTFLANNPRYTLAALPAAYLLAGMGIACFSKRTMPLVLLLIMISWSDAILKIYRQHSRGGEPFLAVAKAVAAKATPSDLIVVHSIPSGILGIARYSDGASMIAPWVRQLGRHSDPASIQRLVAGKSRVFYVLAHPLGEPISEKEWLRTRSVVDQEYSIERIKVTEFRPAAGGTF